MARTAPVPNIPAIPGMNPGIFVMGGGGGGGGSGGKGGKGGGGKKGANGKNGGKDAAGGGKGAKKCGKGTGSACNSCSTKTKAGDPVDVATGRVSTVGRIDVDLPGPLPLQLERSYSSHAVHRDVGLGWGWTHSYAWELVVRRRRIEVWDDEGTMLEWPALKAGDAHTSHGRTVRREPGGYVLSMDGHRFVFGAVFGNVHRLTAVEDTNGNTIRLDYRPDGRLTSLTDSVGRVVRVRHAPDGRIGAFEVQNARSQGRWFPCGEYLYDDRGDLTVFRDAEGFTWRFAYLDGTHLLTAYTDPEGLTFHYLYDPTGRCTETWGAHDDAGTVRGLSPRAPATLADGTPAKGFMHTKIVFVDESLREVVDSKEVRRFEVDEAGNTLKSVFKGHVVTRRYDANGFLVEHVDAIGAVTTWTRDAEGNALTETDPLGNVTHYDHDAAGRLTRVSDAVGRLLEVEYDDRGNVVRLVQGNGEQTTFEVDARGLRVRMTEPSGGVWRYRHDADGNLIEIVEPTGEQWRADYDPLGRRILETQPDGAQVRHAWDASGRLASSSRGSQTRQYRHDGRGNLVRLVDVEGRSLDLTYLLDRAVSARFADGSTRSWSWDREGFLADLLNEKGERYESDADGEGLVREVRSFDGRVQRFAYDPRGRLVRYENARGGVTEWTRDARGQITEVAYPDGDSAGFEYDARGRMIRATNGASSCAYALDGGDQLLREEMTIGDRTFTVDHGYDVLRRRTSLQTSLGHEHAIRRDAKGRAIESLLDRGARVGFRFDVLDREVARELPAGAVIETQWAGPEARGPSRRAVLPATARAAPPRPGEPPWIGPLARAASVDLAWRWSINGERIVESWDADLGSRALEYDAVDQLVSISEGGQRIEEYRYDATGNVHHVPGIRVYGRGNRLERRDDVDYEWDADGFLIAKRRRHPDGRVEAWAYGWDGAGNLATVDTPDGLRVSYAYDPFARRVGKTVVRPTADGPVLIRRSRYVWEKDRIVHEIAEEATGSDDPVVHERTFYYDESRGAPLAEREDVRRANGVVTTGQWRFHVNDPIGTPDHLVGGDGTPIARSDRDAWGATRGAAPTPLRFDGQWADPETGLHYNRYRYYDPEISRYISQDPAGQLPDPNLYRYAVNPISWIDFYGLVHTATATWTPPGGTPVPMNGGAPYNSKYDDYTRDYNKQKGGLHPMTNFAKKDDEGVLAHRTSDTEAKILRDLKKMKKGGENLKGGHLQITGEKPPCSACNRKMASFAKKHGCTIQYTDSSGTPYDYSP